MPNKTVITKSFSYPETNTNLSEWLKNQSSISKSIVAILNATIKKYGTGDLLEAALDKHIVQEANAAIKPTETTTQNDVKPQEDVKKETIVPEPQNGENVSNDIEEEGANSIDLSMLLDQN